MSDTRKIYKICTRQAWRDAVTVGVYRGSSDDVRDGYIHFSTSDQLAGTAAKHFRGQADLVLLAVDAHALGSALVWEPSRGGALFPHLYGTLDVRVASLIGDLALDAAGVPVIPEDFTR